MGTFEGFVQCIRRISARPLFKKALLISYYFTLLTMIFFLAMVALSITYSNSYDPVNFFSKEYRNFSYAGKPVIFLLTSDAGGEITYRPAGNGSITLLNRSRIDVRPNTNCTIISGNSTIRAFHGPITITSSDDAKLDISVEYPDHFSRKYDCPQVNVSRLYLASLLEKKIYLLKFECPNGTLRRFSSSCRYPQNTFLVAKEATIFVDHGKIFVDGTAYTGLVKISGDFDVVSADNAQLALYSDDIYTPPRVNSAEILNIEGSLILPGRYIECKGSDILRIKSVNSTIWAGIHEGRCYVNGQADYLIFRDEQYVTKPVSFFISHDLSLSFALSSIMAIITIFISSAVSRIRKK